MVISDWYWAYTPAIKCSQYPPETDYVPLAYTKRTPIGDITVDGVSHKIFDTGMDGVGIIIEGGLNPGTYTAYGSQYDIFRRSNTSQVSPKDINMKFRVKYVVTKRLAPGKISVPPIAILDTGISVGSPDLSGGEYFWGGAVTTSATTIDVAYPSCSLTVPAKVELPLIDPSKVNGAGATAGDTSFHIDLSCKPGAVDVNVKYTLTDISNLSNVTDTLGVLSETTTAKGFALQVLENGALVNFGPDSSVAGNRNQRDFGVMSKDGGMLSKKLIVRYVRTKEPFIPGILTAGVSVTMSYQ